MSATPWTPGPWEVWPSVGGWTDVIAGDEVVARFDGNYQPTQPDLRLIKEAPEMAALLERLLMWTAGELSATTPLYHDVDALLARIRGETP